MKNKKIPTGKSVTPPREHTPELTHVIELCDYLTRTLDPKMRWMWGEALFGYSLSLLDEYLETETYTPFLKAYCDYYVQHPPRVDYADTAAPALITYYMQKKNGDPGYAHLTARVLDYIFYEPRILGDAVNHLGKSPEGWFYPKSIWVDSLMMFGVFPAIYAQENNDKELLEFAARQPRLYAGYMQDPERHLWYHSYWVKANRPHPGRGIFWGRGNGWVMAALPMLLDRIGPDHTQACVIRKLLRQTADALLPCQLADGSFPTVLGRPTYPEQSATALIASGLLHGVRCGYLPPEPYRSAGKKAFGAVMRHLCKTPDGKILLTDISAPTIPLQIFPYTCYRLTPKGSNWPYGVAAAVFAALEYDRLNS